MELKEAFEAAVANSKKLTERPSNDILLKIYSLYKQATEGDVKGDKPSGFDFKGMAKYKAWEGQHGKSSEQCMEEYVALIESLS